MAGFAFAVDQTGVDCAVDVCAAGTKCWLSSS
jgi:hypothetical protein